MVSTQRRQAVLDAGRLPGGGALARLFGRPTTPFEATIGAFVASLRRYPG